MRIAFFALLLANLAYFAWAHWVDVPQPAPVNEAIRKLATLRLVDELPPAQRPRGDPADKPVAAPTACLSIGPFAEIDASAHAAELLHAKGFDPRQRAAQGPMSDGYWVYVGGIASQVDTDRALVALERSGIKDAIVLPETSDAGRRLSLGLYSERPRADKRAQAARQAGLKAEVAERKIPGTVYWVDLVPPPGMNTVPLQDLFAAGVSSRIAVQQCPPPASAPATTDEPTAAVGGSPKLP